MAKGREVPQMKKLLIVGDAVSHTGFSTVVHNIADNLKSKFQITILGVNYYGDPHTYPYPIYPASLGGDVYGFGRMKQIIAVTQPDIVLIVNDPWIVKEYIPIIKQFPTIKIVCYTPVDGLNVRREFAEALNGCDHVVAYNEFGLKELRKSGLTANASWAPHGVDTSVFHPVPQEVARAQLNIPKEWFIVGRADRNQPRKRIDLTIEYFAEFAKDKPDTVKLYYHGALQDAGYDIVNLCQFHGVEDRLIITSPNITPAQGIPKEMMKFIYSAWDVQVSTTNGEGHGLCTHEGMACGVPQIVPDWAALGDWPADAVVKVPCTALEVRTGGINTIGGLPDKKQFVENLNRMYYDGDYRAAMGRRAYKRATDPMFNWSNVVSHFANVFNELT